MTTNRTLLKHRHLGWLALLIAPAILGAKGCDVAVVGSECGGLTGEQCGADQFCDFAPDAACGAADQTGKCETLPEACAEIFRPVCGCDDRTYGNACEANAAGVSVASEGECDLGGSSACGGITGLQCADGELCNFAPEAQCGAADQLGTCEPTPEACNTIFLPVCGCDGRTYGNDCEAKVAGVSIVSEGECDSGGSTACGGLTGLQCADDEFCNFAPEALCGAADATGTCEPKPQACTREFNPVCGCDGETYSTACVANAAGVSVVSQGECEPTGGGNDCGGITGLQCADDEFCSFAPEAQCGAADQTGTCARRPEACTQQFDPVCGCDGQTYGNACSASSQGVSIASDGECPPSEGEGTACGGLLGAQCADGEFCDFALDAFCGAADQTGICRDIPEACTFELNPVCGCDDETYGNACAANAAGISVAAVGECP